MPTKKVYAICYAFVVCLLLAACSPVPEEAVAPEREIEQPLQELEAAVVSKNEELTEKYVERYSYPDEIDAELIQPTSSNYAVNGTLIVEGTIGNLEGLVTDYAWIQLHYMNDSIAIPTDAIQDQYVPIEDGKFKLETQLFHGEGEYGIYVMLPANDTTVEDYYDAFHFTVFSVNPAAHREITYTPLAMKADLTFSEPASGLLEASEVVTLTGNIDPVAYEGKSLFFELRKDSHYSVHQTVIEDGQFSIDIPLWYGQGIHELLVFISEEEDDLQLGTILYLDSTDDSGLQTIQTYSAFEEHGFTLDSPKQGGDSTDLTYRITGSIDKSLPVSAEVTNLWVSASKGEDTSMSVIPVNDFQFDDEFYLRFGPGLYTVKIWLKDHESTTMDLLFFTEVAQFVVNNTNPDDKRDLLPSRGIQSDAPEIITLANQLITEGMTDYEKAKAIYEYTAKNVSYDVNKLKNIGNEWDDSALKTLELKSGICVDYAYLAAALLRAAGLETRYIVGTAGPSFAPENHAWVEVKADGKWIMMDPTWGSGYIEQNKFVPDYTEDYFNPKPDKLKKHKREGVEY